MTLSKYLKLILFQILIISISLILIADISQASYLAEYNLIYSGEFRMAVDSDQELKLIPVYLFVRGEPAPGLNLLTYLKPGGEFFDQLYLEYNQEDLLLMYGDNTIQGLGGKFFSLDQNQRGGKIAYQLFDQAITLEYLGAKVRGININEEIEGNGSPGPYYLQHNPIIAGSEYLLKNGKALRKEEYQLNYQTGELLLMEPLEKEQLLKVSYTYQPGGGNYERTIKGGSLGLELEEIQSKLAAFTIADQPRVGDFLIFYQPRTLEGAIFTIDLEPTDLLKIKSELAYSLLTEGEEKKQINEDKAYQLLGRLGDEYNYLQGEYNYRGSNFTDSLEQEEPLPFKSYNLEGRWQIDPRLYLIYYSEYSRDNPEDNPELITSYQSNKLYKGYYQYSPGSYIQLLYQEQDNGDDLIYLPIGKTSLIYSIIFHHRLNKNVLELGIDRGELFWKNPAAAGLNHHYYKINSSYSWEKDSWSGELDYHTKLIQLLNQTDSDQLNHFLNYDFTYNLNKGRFSLGGEEELEEDYQRHLYQLQFKKYLLKRLQLGMSYQREEEEIPGIDPAPENSYNLQWLYQGPLLFELRLGWKPEKEVSSAQARLKGKKGGIQLYLLDSKELKQLKNKIDLYLIPGLDLETLLTYNRRLLAEESKEVEQELLLKLTGIYQINRAVKLQLSGETPLPLKGEDGKLNPAENNQQYFKLELIFSL